MVVRLNGSTCIYKEFVRDRRMNAKVFKTITRNDSTERFSTFTQVCEKIWISIGYYSYW